MYLLFRMILLAKPSTLGPMVRDSYITFVMPKMMRLMLHMKRTAIQTVAVPFAGSSETLNVFCAMSSVLIISPPPVINIRAKPMVQKVLAVMAKR
jgi:hypothetical protein